tara:strand:+ start:277 stop:792 length:516 start_codon:yes stop_codon:yes gene_type:complete
MPNAYIQALKKFNEGKGMWCIPKKGTSDYNEVMKIKNKLMGKETKDEVVIPIKEFKKEHNELITVLKEAQDDGKKVKSKLKKEEKKQEKELEKVLEKVSPTEEKFNRIVSYSKIKKEDWERLTDDVKRITVRYIIDDLPQYANMIKKENPLPNMKSLPKYMHEAYKKYMKE